MIAKRNFIGSFRTILASGLLVVTPVVVTLWLLLKLLIFLDSLLSEPAQWILLRFGYEFDPNRHLYGFGLAALFTLILVSGWLSRLYIGKRIYAWVNEWIEKLPVISTIYSTIRPLSRAVFSGQRNFFREVVWAPYQGGFTLGFVVGAAPDLQEKLGKPVVAVYIPFAPPTTGVLLYLERERLIATEMTIEEGFKMLFSFGVSQTEENR